MDPTVPARPSSWPCATGQADRRCQGVRRTSTPAAWRRCSRGGSPTATAPRRVEHKLTEIALGVRNPVMLIRIKPGDMPKVVKRKGQESFNFGDLFAYTKVCSHLGCPSSLYEQQTYRILCPCHQSQFDALHCEAHIRSGCARFGAAHHH